MEPFIGWIAHIKFAVLSRNTTRNVNLAWYHLDMLKYKQTLFENLESTTFIHINHQIAGWLWNMGYNRVFQISIIQWGMTPKFVSN